MNTKIIISTFVCIISITIYIIGQYFISCESLKESHYNCRHTKCISNFDLFDVTSWFKINLCQYCKLEYDALNMCNHVHNFYNLILFGNVILSFIALITLIFV